MALALFRTLVACLLSSVVVADFTAPKYTVDLDRNAADRWGGLVENALDAHGWNHSFGPVIDFMINIIPLDEWKKHDFAFQAIGLGLLGLEYLEEIRGVEAAAIKRGVGDKLTSGMLVFFQLFYELLMECTGLVAKAPDGSVIHGRNMDIGLPVPNITAQVSWVKNGITVATTTQYLGYFGVHTGMRMGGWSVQANERVVLELGPWGYAKSIIGSDLLALLSRHKPVGYVLREALLSAATFDEAVEQLSSAKLVAPLYFIMAGAKAGQGAVITRNRKGLANAPSHKEVLLLNESSTFYLAQTNWDPWIPINEEQCRGTEAALPEWVRDACGETLKLLYGDAGGCAELCRLTSDGRHERAVALLNQMGKEHASTDNLFKILSDNHVEQGDTQFTALMNPQTSEYRTIVREHKRGENQQPNVMAEKVRETAIKLFKWLVRLGEAQQSEVVV